MIGFRLSFTDGDVLFVSQDVLTPTGEGCYTGTLRGISFRWTFSETTGGTLIDFEAESEKPLNLCRIDSYVRSIGEQKRPTRYSFYTNASAHGETRFPEEVGIDREYFGDGVGVYDDFLTPGVTLCGLIPFDNVFKAGIVTRLSGNTEIFAATEYTKEAAQSCRLRAERVLLCDAVTPERFYGIYRDLLPQSTFPMPKLTGWNTWDYYLDRVTVEDVRENVEALKDLSFASKLDYIVIDDGWQKEWGVWTENEKFSCGIASVAEMIRGAGFRAGIWMAPLAVTKDGSLLKRHPEWFCRNPDGSLFLSGMYYLDPTHPEAEAYILDNYRYQYRAGYRLFKIDYLSPLLQVRTFHDPDATAYSALRTLMKKVIAATGDDVVILGCSLPVQCGADIAPSMRIGVDIHNHWDHVYWIADSLKYTWMYNNKVTRIDPDFCVVRGEETADEPLVWEGQYNGFVPPPRAMESNSENFKRHWRHGDQFNAMEAETWANLVAVCGGNLFLSDRISKLNQRGISILENAFSIAGNEGRPRHLKDDERRPSVWESERSIVVINWTEVPQTMTVPDVFHPLISHKPFTLNGTTLTVTLQPHESFSALYAEDEK